MYVEHETEWEYVRDLLLSIFATKATVMLILIISLKYWKDSND